MAKADQEKYTSLTNKLKQKLNKVKEESSVLQKNLEETETAAHLGEAQRDKLQGAYNNLRISYKSLQSSMFSLEKQNQSLMTHLHTLSSKNLIDNTKLETLESIMGEIKAKKKAVRDKLDLVMKEIAGIINYGGEGVVVKRQPTNIKVALMERVLFHQGRANLTKGAKISLDDLGESLKRVGGLRVRIVGHADNTPIGANNPFRDNWELSTARAHSVLSYLLEDQLVEPQDVELVGRSFYEPSQSNMTHLGRAENRRVELVISPILTPDGSEDLDSVPLLTH